MARALKVPANRRESNIWQDSKTGRWKWEIELRRRDGTTFRKGGSRKTEKEARESRDKAYAEFNRNEGRNANGHTVRSWCEHCMDHLWPNELAPSTESAYRHWLTTRVFPTMGATSLDALSIEQLQIFFNRLQEKDTETAAARTRVALASALTRAVEQGLIPSNPCQSVKLRSSRKSIDDEEEEHAKRLLTMEELRLLVEAARPTRMRMPVALGALLGLRFGECMGLDFKHIDLEQRVVRVRKQRQNVRGKGLSVVDLKTKASRRDLPIPDLLFEILVEEKALAESQGREAVCVWTDGKPYSPQNGSVFFKEFVSRAGFDGKDGRPIPTHHCLRASILTWLANHANDGAGVRPAILLKYAGHSKIDTTMRYYVRASEDDLRAAVRAIPTSKQT